MVLKEIFDGWRNHILPPSALKKEIKRIHTKRINICESCEHHSKHHDSIRPDDHCTICGCTLVAKTKCLSCKCPIDKWMDEIEEQHEEIIKNNV